MLLLIFLCIGKQTHAKEELAQGAQGRAWPVLCKTQAGAPSVIEHSTGELSGWLYPKGCDLKAAGEDEGRESSRACPTPAGVWVASG